MIGDNIEIDKTKEVMCKVIIRGRVKWSVIERIEPSPWSCQYDWVSSYPVGQLMLTDINVYSHNNYTMTAQEARKKADKAIVKAILCSIEFYTGEGKAEHKIDSKVGTGDPKSLKNI